MLDQSLPERGRRKNPAGQRGCGRSSDKIKALPPTAILGLWTFDGHEGRSEVATGPLGDPVNGQPRSAALTAALDKQYSSPRRCGVVHHAAHDLPGYADQLPCRPNEFDLADHLRAAHRPVSGWAGLQNFIRHSADPAKPIAVNVIDFGADPDRATWEAVAQLSGGTYQNLSTSASPDLAAAINTFLS